jgi:hypothetical protein
MPNNCLYYTQRNSTIQTGNEMRRIGFNRLAAMTVVLASICAAGVWASTVAIVGGSATPDGRALLMKNRDNSEGPNQEFVYNNAGPYSYISVTYKDSADQAFGGVNNVGFAIINSNAWNFNDPIPGPDDDGFIIRQALRTCRTVDEFQVIMDSTNLTGRTRPANYGVVDATGNGAFFEAAATVYYRYNLSDSSAAPHGYMVRANFAYSGSTYHLGQNRHDRVMALLDSAYAGNFITHGYISQVIQRDLINDRVNPYPLPFQGKDQSLPYGLLHSHECLNRDISKSGLVIQTTLPTESPLLSTVWALVGEPITIPSLPLWILAQSVPVEFDGPSGVGSSLNNKALQFRDYVYQFSLGTDALDTWRLMDDRGQGLLPLLVSLENQAISRGDSALAVWRQAGLPAPGIAAFLQNTIATTTFNQLNAWGPPVDPEVSLTRLNPTQIRLDWSPITTDIFGRPLTVTGYTIYQSAQAPYNRLSGDSLTTVTASPVTLPASSTNQFYQVRARR